MKIKILQLFLFILFFIGHLNSSDFKTYNILFIDISNDKRYTEWGIHPVDIRSNLKKEKRPLEGAKLAIEDTKRIERITKTKFFLEHKRLDNYIAVITYLHNIKNTDYDAILLDIKINDINTMKKVLEKKENILFFNISDPNNEIRTNMCVKNFFNTFPSNLMLTDSLAQYLVKKKWNKTLLLTGPLKEDKEYSDAFKKSAKKFGVKVVGENFFVNNNDPRVRDKNNLSYLTKGRKYKSVLVSDIDGEFSLSVPNATMAPSIVIGSSGLKAHAWHWSYLRHGAPQLNGRFERLNNRRMESADWAAWIAIKSISESIMRVQSNENNKIFDYLNSNNLQIDGSKGISLNFRSSTNQLRQTILLTSSNNWVTAKVPLQEFQNSDNNLDTIGISIKDAKCVGGD